MNYLILIALLCFSVSVILLLYLIEGKQEKRSCEILKLSQNAPCEKVKSFLESYAVGNYSNAMWIFNTLPQDEKENVKQIFQCINTIN